MYPIGCAFPRTEPMVDDAIQGFTNPITIYYREFVVCGFSTCKGLKKTSKGICRSTLLWYGWTTKYRGSIIPIVEKDSIGPVEPTRCVEHLLDNVRKNLIPKYVDSLDEDKEK